MGRFKKNKKRNSKNYLIYGCEFELLLYIVYNKKMNKIFYFITLILCILNISNAKKIEQLENFKFPTVLSESDKKLYMKIIEYQKIGDWDLYDKTSDKLENNILLGYFEYDKLMHPNKYRANYKELSTWLRKYEDFPVVMRKRVHKLMLKRAQSKVQKLNYRKPIYGNYLRGYGENIKKRDEENINKQTKKEIKKKFTYLFENKLYYKLVKFINAEKSKKDYKIFLLNNKVKQIFLSGLLLDSHKIYEYFYKNINIEDREMLLIAGINSFRLGEHKSAVKYFDKCNKIDKIKETRYEEWHISGCLYWFSKVNEKSSQTKKALKKASYYPRTIYGQLALEKLGLDEPFKWEMKIDISKNDFKNILNYKSFSRILALSELNLYDKGDLELRNLYSQLGKKNNKVLYYVSEKLGLAAVQMRLGEKFRFKDHTLFIRGLYPTPDWKKQNDIFKLDKAFILALIRRESAFNIKAKSPKGARGLMQLMPRTASKIQKDYRLRYGHVHKLYSLQLNLDLGQRYLSELLYQDKTKRSLLDVLITYNAGVKRPRKWKIYSLEGDPLAFIESIPLRETRWFVKNILTDMWIYRDKLGQEKPTRKSLANNVWPKYKELDFPYSRDAKLR